MCELQVTESCAGSGNEAANAPYLPFHYAPLAATYEHSHSKMLFEPTYGFQNTSAKCLLQVTAAWGHDLAYLEIDATCVPSDCYFPYK